MARGICWDCLAKGKNYDQITWFIPDLEFDEAAARGCPRCRNNQGILVGAEEE